MKIVEFISTFEYYDAEESGAKCYTIRDATPRTLKKSAGATHIRIRMGYTKVSFIREISHRLDWKDNVILAWRDKW